MNGPWQGRGLSNRSHLHLLRLLAAFAISLGSALLSNSGHAAIRGGDDSFSILLCKSADAGTPTKTLADIQKDLLDKTAGGVATYWWQTSLGTFDMANSDIHGWYSVSATTSAWLAQGDYQKTQTCEDAAKSDSANPFTVPAGRRVLVVTYPKIRDVDVGDRAIVPFDADVGSIAHEGGHALGLIHSYSNDLHYENAWWSERGEYDDPWDAMSWQVGFPVSTPYGSASAWLDGQTLDALGWIPRSRIVTVGADGNRSSTITLTALSHSSSPGALLLRVPFDVDDPNHYFTVEYRQKDSWDANIPASTILISEVSKAWDTSLTYKGHVAHLYRDLTTQQKNPLQTIAMRGLIIKTLNINEANGTAQVAVVTDFVDRCNPGFFWREVTSFDRVCVSAADRDTVQKEDAAPASHKAGQGASGPDTCDNGYVWRDAVAIGALFADYPGDHICVTPARRSEEAENNAKSAQNSNPAKLTFGPNACKPGFVWREADDWDWVCVSSQERTTALQENTLASSRKTPGGGASGPDTCLAGFVWREAYPSDHVCVPPAERQNAIAQNASRVSRWIAP